MQVAEGNLAKKQKELASMQQMVQTYKQNPKFGNAKQFAGEIGKLNTVIGEIEAALGKMDLLLYSCYFVLIINSI